MAENIAAEILAPVIEDGVKRAGATIIRQFNYLCCFTSNITTLKDEAQALDDEARGLQGRVDGARNDTQIIVPAVETWMTKSEAINAEMDEILNEVPNVGSGCLKLKSRFSLSKRAKKTTDCMKDHRGQCKFDVISHPRPPAATEAVPLGTTYEFQSRKQIEEDIMTSLRDGDVNMIGICGMGGLGKTTMAKMIMNRALKEHVFEEVVMAVVSQPVDELKIQVEIGELLGLKNLKEQASMGNRRQMLHARLTEGTKRILLVLDDVWERLVVEELGIPRGSKGCTILLTSRNRDVLRAMDVGKVFGMKILSEEDAWLLFRGRAGICVDDTGLNSIAKEVVKECKGLPIALTTVGSALKDEKNKGIWKDAVRQLRKASPINIPDYIKDVFNPLKVSYDRLDSEEAKSVFLLCCLFNEDVNISLEKLTYFCMGLGVFDGGMEEARDWMCTLTKMLKSRSLLLDGYNEDHVRMHDVVRDICIFIAKQGGYIDHNDCTWLSSSFQQGGGRNKLPTNLRLFFLTRNSEQRQEIKFDKSFVEGIKDLNVLCIEGYSSLTSLPHTTESLKNLNSLMLYSCWELESLSVLGEMVNLKILVCQYCDSIKELPPEIKGLNHLKLLDLTGCGNLERINRGIISSLVGLEELKMMWSFKKWEASDRKGQNAGLSELESLINLRCLEIEIEDPSLVAENMRLSSNLERFDIIIPFPSSRSANEFFSYSSNKGGNKILSLEWEGGSCVGDWIEMLLLKDTECLRLTGNGANNVYYMANSENIKGLELGKCENIKNIGRTSSLMHNDGVATVLPSMEFLNLFSLPDLKEIWHGPISLNSLQNLKELFLKDLPVLQQFWKGSSIRQLSTVNCLPQLEVLEIRKCEMMEQVFSWNEEDDQNINDGQHITKMFPKLKEVILFHLPNLTTFFQGIEGIEFPLLRKMLISACPKMTGMVSSNEKNSGGSINADMVSSNENSGGSINADNIDDHNSFLLFCELEKVSFGNLKELTTDRNPFSCGHRVHESLFNGLEKLNINHYGGIMRLFSPSIIGNLVNLIELTIHSCAELVEVIKDDEEEDRQTTTLQFPKLQKLRLWFLPKLVSFCEWKCDVELGSLRELNIHGCPNMKYFTLGLLTAPDLEAFVLVNFNNCRQVPYDNQKALSIEGNENPFYPHIIPVSLFKGLQQLTIREYKGSMSLFTSSTVENLVSLRILSVRGCDEMVKVIEDEEEKEKEKEKEEEKVVISAAAQRTTLLFPELQELQLYDLPKLVSLCEWKCDVQLRSLTKVGIWRCPNLKYFTLGLLTTPKLESIQIASKDFGGVKDLNDMLQQHYLAQEKEKEEEEKKGGAEEQETKVVIKDNDNSSTI